MQRCAASSQWLSERISLSRYAHVIVLILVLTVTVHGVLDDENYTLDIYTGAGTIREFWTWLDAIYSGCLLFKSITWSAAGLIQHFSFTSFLSSLSSWMDQHKESSLYNLSHKCVYSSSTFLLVLNFWSFVTVIVVEAHVSERTFFEILTSLRKVPAYWSTYCFFKQEKTFDPTIQYPYRYFGYLMLVFLIWEAVVKKMHVLLMR